MHEVINILNGLLDEITDEKCLNLETVLISFELNLFFA